MEKSNGKALWIGTVPLQHLNQMEQQSFWQTIERTLQGKQLFAEQKVDAAIIFRFMVMQEVFGVTLRDLERDVRNAKKLNFIYNLQGSIPEEAEVDAFKQFLKDKGYLETIIDRCKLYLVQIGAANAPKLHLHGHSDVQQCPQCNSTHLFSLRRNLVHRLLNRRRYRCFSCEHEFETKYSD